MAMMHDKKLLELEGQRGIFQIILALYNNGETIYGKLYNNKPFVEISNNSTAKRALDILERNGLICKRKVNKTRAIYIKLTKKGHRFAKCIIDIQELLLEK